MTITDTMYSTGHRYAVASLIVGAVLISFSGVWIELSHVTPTVSAFYRVFFGGVILLAATLFRGETKWHGKGHLLLGLVCGALFAIDLTFYHYSVIYVGPGLGTILPNFQVFILSAVGILLFKEKVRVLFLISIPLAFCGLFFIVGIDWNHLGRLDKVGVYFGLSAAICYAAFLLFLRKLQKDQAGLTFFYVLTMISIVAAAFLAAEVLRTGETFDIPDLQSLLALGALGLFSQVIGWMLITNALPKVQASLSGFILLLQPALAFVWDVLLFRRPTSPVNWAGVIIVLAAIYLGSMRTLTAEQTRRND